MKKQIPNIFTLLNLVFGCLAIVAVLQKGIVLNEAADGTQLIEIPEKIYLASVFIGLAALVDFLDGFVARLFNATSEMGKQLDSLADIVSFGVAPSMILFQFLRMSFAAEENGMQISSVFLMPSFFVAAAAAYRLAKFNLDVSQEKVFKGMPTPAVGLLIASFPLIYWHSDNSTIIQILVNKWFLYAVILFVSWIMLSNISMMALKFKSFGFKENAPKIILLLSSLLLIILFKWLAVPLIFISYIILSVIYRRKIEA